MKKSSPIKEGEDNLNDERNGIIPNNIYDSPEITDMYVEYLKDMQGEEPFMAGGKKYQYVWAKYPDGKKDVGVYAYQGDVTYSNDYFRKTLLNLKEDITSNEESTESSTQPPIKFAIAYIENGKKSWLIKIDGSRTDWDWAERPFKLESNVMKFNSFEEANNVVKHMRSSSRKVIVVDSKGKQYTKDDVAEASELKSGYVKNKIEKDNPSLYPKGWKEMDGMFMGPKSKLKEDAFSTNGDTSGTDDVTKALGGIKGTEAVSRLIQKLKQTPDLVNLMKNIKTPEDKQIVAVELDKMLNLPAATIPRVGKALNTVIGAEDKLNVSKTAAENVNPKMTKGKIVEFVNKLKPRRVVKENIKIKEINEKSKTLTSDQIYDYILTLSKDYRGDNDSIDFALKPFSEFELKSIPTEDLPCDGCVVLDDKKINNYKNKFKKENKYPPVVVIYDNDGYMTLLDGCHRANALKQLGVKTIKAYVPIMN